jgi:hypothetical protein
LLGVLGFTLGAYLLNPRADGYQASGETLSTLALLAASWAWGARATQYAK